MQNMTYQVSTFPSYSNTVMTVKRCSLTASSMSGLEDLLELLGEEDLMDVASLPQYLGEVQQLAQQQTRWPKVEASELLQNSSTSQLKQKFATGISMTEEWVCQEIVGQVGKSQA
eukprot:TRINITY_DN31858_c4_g1_i1.p2 TRINITY_DN31858_c4_g1~~TRINITY_DN31858_c4_g1_i1.p2  ORF type:complete len:115 (+),score=24.97 TRINITY_DN31858_c4_g1_i1:57-401(+)